MKSILDIIRNKGVDLGVSGKYAAIMGESPSKGARSPTLWNAVFKELGIPGRMHPMDLGVRDLKAAVDCLRADDRFIGGAVAVPHKVNILKYLDEIEPEAAKIGAANCIYRNGAKLVGSNTDGAGALWSLENKLGGRVQGKNVLLLGTGGAGCAVATCIAFALNKGGRLMLANRSREALEKTAGKLKDVCDVEVVSEWPVSPSRTGAVDVLVNCTSIGASALRHDQHGRYTLRPFTPLGSVDEFVRLPVDAGDGDVERKYMRAACRAVGQNAEQTVRALSVMRNALVCDIVYQPRQTALLFMAEMVGCGVLNGVPMNLEQAVIAFDKATMAAGMRSSDAGQVRAIMSRAS